MEPIYLLYSTRSSGWLNNSGSYSSEVKDALHMPRSEAIAICSKHYNKGMEQFGMIPVAYADIKGATQ